MQALFDVGTSNLRLYLLKEGELVYSRKSHYGCRDVSMGSGNEGLKEIMRQMLSEAALSCGSENIDEIYASGVVSSPFGLLEVAHISLPVTPQKLAQSVYIWEDNGIFPLPLRIIPGVRTELKDKTHEALRELHSIRGEEIEAMGLLNELEGEKAGSFVALFPGSHSHGLFMQQGSIADMLCMFAGELYCALQTATVLSAPLKVKDFTLDREELLFGWSCLREEGFNRAVCIAHAMHILGKEPDEKVASYMEGVIQGGVVECLSKRIKTRWQDAERIVIAGDGIMSRAYKILLEEALPDIPCDIFTEAALPLACAGLIKLMEYKP